MRTTQGYVDQKEQEKLLVVQADAVVHPRAMMIHTRHTSFTNWTVVTLRHLNRHALLTLLRKQALNQLQLLRRHLLHFTFLDPQSRTAGLFRQGRLLRNRRFPWHFGCSGLLVLVASFAVAYWAVRVLNSSWIPIVETVYFAQYSLIRIEAYNPLVKFASNFLSLNCREAIILPVDSLIMLTPMQLMPQKLINI